MGTLEESLELFYELQDDCVEKDAVSQEEVKVFTKQLLI